MTDSSSTTMQVLNFINAKVDSAMPSIKAGVSGAIEATERYGTSWAKFRAWEYALGGIGYLLLTAFSLVLAFLAYKLAKSLTDPGMAFKWDNNWNSESPKSMTVAVLTALSVILFWIGVYHTIEILPRGLAAVAEPQGFAVQMLIEGIK